MLDLTSLCQFITPLIAAFQSVLDSVFGALSFLGVTAPNLLTLLSPIVSCTS